MISLTQPVQAMIEAILIIGLVSLTTDFLMRPRLTKLPVPSPKHAVEPRKAA